MVRKIELKTMTNEELQKIIDQFDEEALKHKGIFGISQYGGGSEESFISANKEGLELFALELLKSARDTESLFAESENKFFSLNPEEKWIDQESDTFIHYIEPLSDNFDRKPRTEQKTTFAQRILPIGCGLLVVIVLLITIIVGALTLVGWLI